MAFEWADKPRILTPEQQADRLQWLEQKLAGMNQVTFPGWAAELAQERDQLRSALEQAS